MSIGNCFSKTNVSPGDRFFINGTLSTYVGILAHIFIFIRLSFIFTIIQAVLIVRMYGARIIVIIDAGVQFRIFRLFLPLTSCKKPFFSFTVSATSLFSIDEINCGLYFFHLSTENKSKI